MADALSVVPAAVLRNLSDKLYEKRKNAALEVHNLHMHIILLALLDFCLCHLPFILLFILFFLDLGGGDSETISDVR